MFSCTQSICAVLGLGHVDQVTPCLQQYQLMLKAMKDMEKVGGWGSVLFFG